MQMQVQVAVKKVVAIPPNGECTMEGVPRGRLNLAWVNPRLSMPSHQYGTEGRADVWAHLDEKEKSGNQRTQSIAEQTAVKNKKSSTGKFANCFGGSETITKSVGLPNASASSAFRTKGVYAL